MAVVLDHRQHDLAGRGHESRRCEHGTALPHRRGRRYPVSCRKSAAVVHKAVSRMVCRSRNNRGESCDRAHHADRGRRGAKPQALFQRRPRRIVRPCNATDRHWRAINECWSINKFEVLLSTCLPASKSGAKMATSHQVLAARLRPNSHPKVEGGTRKALACGGRCAQGCSYN